MILGLKSQMKKWEAEKALQAIIDKETGGKNIQPSPAYTLGWFWEQRYRPLKEPTWKPSSAPKAVYFIDNYVVEPFRSVSLGKMNRFEIQKHLNGLSERFSRSVVVNFRTYIRAILDEALEQDFIAKNPARKLDIPATRKPCSRALTIDEVAALLSHMSGRDRLIVRCFLVLGLRPGELFSLRRNDRMAASLRVDESVSAPTPRNGAQRGRGTILVDPKTPASIACVWLPRSLQIELDFWMAAQTDKTPEAFIFASKAGTSISYGNWRKRMLQRAAKKIRDGFRERGEEVPVGFLEGVTLQALRRTCATHMQHLGSVKDIQAHLRHARPNVTAEVICRRFLRVSGRRSSRWTRY